MITLIAAAITMGAVSVFFGIRWRQKWLSARSDIDYALGMLGQDKVVTDEESRAFWGNLPFVTALRYSRQTIRRCYLENRTGKNNWHLVFVFGKIGVKHKLKSHLLNGPCLKYLLNSSWLSAIPEAGYYLIDFKPHFCESSWLEQSLKIERRDGRLFRAPEAVFAEALIVLSGTKRAADALAWIEHSHWGDYANGEKRLALRISRGGLIAFSFHHELEDNNELCVALSLKHDF